MLLPQYIVCIQYDILLFLFCQQRLLLRTIKETKCTLLTRKSGILCRFYYGLFTHNENAKTGHSFCYILLLWRRARDSAHFVRPRVCSANYPIIDFFWQDFVLQKIVRVRIPFLLSNKKQDIACATPCFLWRRARDSNPRTVLGGYTISNRAPSTSSDNSP